MQENQKATLELIRGDVEPLLLEFKYAEDQTPVVVSDYKVFLTLKRDPKQPDTEALLRVKVAHHPEGATGKIYIQVNEVDWATGFKGAPVPSGKCVFDIQLVDDQGKPKTLIYGDCIVVQDVTHGTEI